jgi:hypothetical protein
MALGVLLILALAAFITVVVSAMGRCPLWISVIILCLIELLRELPL